MAEPTEADDFRRELAQLYERNPAYVYGWLSQHVSAHLTAVERIHLLDLLETSLDLFDAGTSAE